MSNEQDSEMEMRNQISWYDVPYWLEEGCWYVITVPVCLAVIIAVIYCIAKGLPND